MSFVNKLVRTTEIFSGKNWSHILKNEASQKCLPFSTKIEVPTPPKKPLTAYMIFCKENRPVVLKDNPALTSPQQIKILAEKWSLLSSDLKKVYEDSARKGTIMYGELHKNFYENLTEEQRLELSRVKAEKRASRRLLKLKKALQESGMPRHARTAYALFLHAQANKREQLKGPPTSIKEGAVLWRNMSDEEKKPFHEQARLEKEQYEKEMKVWHDRLEKEGKSDLLTTYKETKLKLKNLDSDDVSVTIKSLKKNIDTLKPKN